MNILTNRGPKERRNLANSLKSILNLLGEKLDDFDQDKLDVLLPEVCDGRFELLKDLEELETYAARLKFLCEQSVRLINIMWMESR